MLTSRQSFLQDLVLAASTTFSPPTVGSSMAHCWTPISNSVESHSLLETSLRGRFSLVRLTEI